MHCLIDFPETNGARLRLSFQNPRKVLMAWRQEEVRPLLREIEAEAVAGRWCVGMVSYEAAPAFDPAFKVHARCGFPLVAFAVFDSYAELPTPSSGEYRVGEWLPDADAVRFAQDFAAIKAAIYAGAVYQINYTTRLRGDFSGDVQAYFEALRANQPGAYCASLDWGTHCVLSASPELFFRREQGQIITRPMKGTAPRGSDDAEDARNTEALRSNDKERAENLMIVDLIRNDLGRIAVPGSVKVASLFDIEVLPTVLQMTSTIHARPQPGATLEDIFAALFPCGSVTGAPKISAMQYIKELEKSPRGVYCGAIGVVKPGGEAVFNVGIRSITLESPQANSTLRKAEYGVGSGIVWDSTYEGEAFEFRVKARILRRAAKAFMLLETLRLEHGAFWLLNRHVERLRASARYFAFVFDEVAVRGALNCFAQMHAAAQGALRVRLLLARDGTLRLEEAPLPDTLDRVRVQLADTAMDTEDEFLYHKTTQRDHFQRHVPTGTPTEESAATALFDTLLHNAAGEFTEFTRGNVVFDLNGCLCTPPVACGLLPGTFRQELLDACKIIEARITQSDIVHAKAIWFINSLRGWVKVEMVERVGKLSREGTCSKVS